MPTKNAPGFPTWTDPDDAPELTPAMLGEAEAFQGDTFVKRGRGRPPTENAKELVSLRLDQDVVAKLREAGPGWQSQVNGLLRAALCGGGDIGGRRCLGAAFQGGSQSQKNERRTGRVQKRPAGGWERAGRAARR